MVWVVVLLERCGVKEKLHPTEFNRQRRLYARLLQEGREMDPQLHSDKRWGD